MPFSPQVLARTLIVTVLALECAGAHAQADFPNKTVRIIVPFGPGGASDALPRLIAPPLSKAWGQPVIVDNRPGAAGNIGMELGARAAPDGYTLTSAPVGNLAINPHLYTKLPYDVLRDFAPAALVGSLDNILVIHPSIPAHSVKELIALMKQRPGEMTFGSGGIGSQSHLAGEQFKALTNTNMTHVAYKGVGEVVTALLGGHLSMLFAQVPSVKSHIESKKLRVLGIARTKRSPVLPDVPTISEAANLPPFEAISWYALVAPVSTPAEVIRKIHADISKALQTPDIREKFSTMGVEPGGISLEQLRAQIRSDYDRYGATIKQLKIKAE